MKFEVLGFKCYGVAMYLWGRSVGSGVLPVLENTPLAPLEGGTFEEA
jgi:hypothetical protein